jgi:probable rRNA maturation factor
MPHDDESLIQIEFAADLSVSIDVDALRAILASLLHEERVESAELAIQLADDAVLRALNAQHRGIDAPTDVLSFDAASDLEGGEAFPSPVGEASYLGDVVVSVEYAARQAAEVGVTLDEELQHLVLHGVLHLLGFDHETDEDAAKMERREEVLLGAHIHQGRVHEDG